jgi:hypothetical protein
VEADYGTLIEARGASLKDLMFNHRMRKKLRPRILLQGEECRHYMYRNHATPPGHSLITLELEDDDEVLHLVLVKSPEDMLTDQHKQWNLVVGGDYRLSAVVTLIKSAYLTLFRILGYSYALSPSGLDIGRYTLGRFYEENVGKPMPEVRKAAVSFFRPYRHMVRPVGTYGGNAPRGTVEDSRLGVCFGSSGRPFALLVWVRVDESLHAVLMPGFNHADSVEAYWSFLKNDEDRWLHVSEGIYDAENGHWEVCDRPTSAFWPKEGGTFDFE